MEFIIWIVVTFVVVAVMLGAIWALNQAGKRRGQAAGARAAAEAEGDQL